MKPDSVKSPIATTFPAHKTLLTISLHSSPSISLLPLIKYFSSLSFPQFSRSKKIERKELMFSRESVRKSLPSIRRVVVASQRLNARPSSTQSHASASSSSSSSSSSLSSCGVKFFALNRFLRSASSGILVLGSGLGLFYYFSVSRDANSYISFAEYSNETATWEANEGDERFQQSKPQEKRQLFLFGDAYRRRVFFKYEKRIRMQSSPEKVFEYFASVREPSGEVFMTPADLMRAVVPVFPPSESNRVREGFLRGERVPSELHCPPSSFFMLFDTNNDGLISFEE